ncbi:hypothetical protein HJG60_009054 [Phyllostomus discolor]|uniref:Uncharacterized protein n=1 Tax=Phyllostomus discolor TaxID=89673 RepID=A0A833YPD1_9CHIR|nr:hypothetical protein HJG60_009054 [Phyllostomus discolor]
MRTPALSKLRGEGPSPPFAVAPQVLPWGFYMIMPVLGHSTLGESYPSLANRSNIGGQVWEKEKKQCSCQGDKLCLLSGLWSEGHSLSLSHGAGAGGGGGAVTAPETRQGGFQQKVREGLLEQVTLEAVGSG